VLVNLVMNSRDALSSGGEIRVTVKVVRDSELICRVFPGGVQPGQAACIEVSDNGTGMSQDVLERVFEPYFSTKKDKGTGLGLSTVVAIVTGSRGVIDIDSTMGSGTTISVYFPYEVAAGEVSLKGPTESRPQLERGNERVLVVDDEDPVRNVLYVSLQHLGYQVEIAASGAEALEKVSSSRSPFDLVILDMLMPHLAGDQVFFKLKDLDPRIRVLVISGYSSEEAVQRILDNGGKGFIQKPFTIEDLSKKVRECLTDHA
ncbi:MAG: response regulator, partial [Bdellovibrionales bacterium]|nr:response regulator [Bdellovibrionales bacterium]